VLTGRDHTERDVNTVARGLARQAGDRRSELLGDRADRFQQRVLELIRSPARPGTAAAEAQALRELVPELRRPEPDELFFHPDAATATAAASATILTPAASVTPAPATTDAATVPALPRFRPASQADLAPSGEVSRIRANLAALRTLRSIQADDRAATPDEQQVLARWSGWGAVPAAVDPADTKYEWVRDELAQLMDDKELAAARRTVINAHYTDAALVQAIWDGVRELGFDGGGRVLEPGAGSGNFIAFAPDNASITGVELDPTTAAIAAALHPHAEIRAESFAVTRAAPGQFDLSIGNVPFGDVRLHDKSHNGGNHAIHNHFILKALHLTRPGGLVAVITSAYTMDAANPAARREMAELGDLVGAVRLPSRAHARAAGTDALTDVLILRRREPGRDPAPFDWEYTVPVDIDGTPVRINSYFAARPQQVLGQLTVGDGLYRHDEVSVSGDPAAAPVQLQAALAEIAAEARAAGLVMVPRTGEPVAARAAARLPEAGQLPDGYLRANPDGTFSRLDDGRFEAYQPVKNQAGELRALLGLRDTAVALLEAEAASLDDTSEIGQLRTQLGARYDAYVTNFGPLNRFTDVPRKTKEKTTGKMIPAVDEETGKALMRRVRPGQGGFRHDPFSVVVRALEHFDEENHTASKADIFTGRVVSPRSPRLGADNPAEALSISLDEHGAARLDTIAWLLGVTETEARAALGELVYDDPATGRLEPAAAYLSGDVKTKLAQARLAADGDDRYTVNVAALTAVQPRDLGPDEISIKMGAPWVGPEIVRQFLAEILEDPQVTVEYDGGSMWSVHGTKAHGVAATSTWGTDRRDGYEVAQHILEQREFVIKDVISRNPHREVVNLDAIMAATEKAVEMRERFADWVWEDPQRAAELVARYNDLFQRYVPRSYDGIQLSLPGLAMAFKPDPHQIAAVARIINEPAVGLYHAVGAGKTATMIMGVMELRRLGLVQKPVIVVPNQLLDQWSREFNRLYPQAKLLAAGTEDLDKDRRKLMVARMATGNWDAVILTESAFEMLPMSPQAEQGYLDGQTAELDERIDKARAAGSERILKRLEKTKLNAEERLKGKLDTNKDEGIWWELTGIDYIVRDESHRDKNLRTVSRVPGMSIKGSQRAQQMDLKLGWLRDNKARWGVRATGTPMANSIVEIFTEFRYLRPDLMVQLGCVDIDSWLATFSEGKMIIEVTPDGGGLRNKTRLEFVNLDELVTALHVFADVKTKDELNLKRPLLAKRADGQRLPEMVVVQPSEELLVKVNELVERAAKLKGKRPEKGADNILKIVGEGAAAALDLRLVGLSTDEPQKIHKAAERIATRYHAHAERIYDGPNGEPHRTPGALQMVFCDLGTPSDKDPEKWTAYGELRKQLVERGVPRQKIAFIHEAKDDRARAELFAAARDGRIAVLVSSTEKGGTGVNVQDRLIALSHLDCPYRPCDLEQRDGRADRRGNQNEEIIIERYVTERSLDAFKWQKVAFKARQADLILTGRAGRRAEDIGEVTMSYEEMKAAATGNPLLVDHAKAKAELGRLERSLRGHQRNQAQLKWRITNNRQEIGINRAAIAEAEAALAKRVPTRGDDFAIAIKNTVYTKHEDANERLRTVLGLMLADRSIFRVPATEVGAFGGFKLLAQSDQILFSPTFSAPGIRLTLDGVPRADIELQGRDLDGADIITRLQNRLSKIEEVRDQLVADIAAREHDSARTEQELAKPFRHEQALQDAKAEFRRLDIEVTALAAASENEANRQAAYAADGSAPAGGVAQHGQAGGGRALVGSSSSAVSPTVAAASTADEGPSTAANPAEVMSQASLPTHHRDWLSGQLAALAADQHVIDVARSNTLATARRVLLEHVETLFARSLDAAEVGGQDLAVRYFDDETGFRPAFDDAAARFLFDTARTAPPTPVDLLRAQFDDYHPTLRRALNDVVSPKATPEQKLSAYQQALPVLSTVRDEHRSLISDDLTAMQASGTPRQRAAARSLLARLHGTDEQLTVEQGAAVNAASGNAHGDMAERTRRYGRLSPQAFAQLGDVYREAILDDLQTIAGSNAPGRARRGHAGVRYRTTAGFVSDASALMSRFQRATTEGAAAPAQASAETAIRVQIDGNSVLACGTSKADTVARAALKEAKWRWYPSLQAWGLPRNLTPAVRQRNLDAFLDAMRRQGREVTVVTGDTAAQSGHIVAASSPTASTNQAASAIAAEPAGWQLVALHRDTGQRAQVFPYRGDATTVADVWRAVSSQARQWIDSQDEPTDYQLGVERPDTHGAARLWTWLAEKAMPLSDDLLEGWPDLERAYATTLATTATPDNFAPRWDDALARFVADGEPRQNPHRPGSLMAALHDSSDGNTLYTELVDAGIRFAMGQFGAQDAAIAEPEPAPAAATPPVTPTPLVPTSDQPDQTAPPSEDVPRARQILLQAAIEHAAARWATVPGVGRAGASRYIWETVGGTKPEYEWISTYLQEYPEVFDLPLPPAGYSLNDKRKDLAGDADRRAAVAFDAGDYEAALQALEEAEALHPSPGDFFARAREVVHGAMSRESAAVPAAQETSRPAETQRTRRGHAFYPPDALARQIPPLYGTDKQQPWEKVIHLHYFGGSHDFWLAEYDPRTGDAYGYVCTGDPHSAEWGYVHLPEIEAVRGQGGLMIIERDLYWTPRPASQVNLPGQRADNRRPAPDPQPAPQRAQQALPAYAGPEHQASITSFDQWRAGPGQRATVAETHWLHTTIAGLAADPQLQQAALNRTNDTHAFRLVFEPRLEQAMLDAFEQQPHRQSLLGWAFFDQGGANRAQLVAAACAEVYHAITSAADEPDIPASASSAAAAAASPVRLARLGLQMPMPTQHQPSAVPTQLSLSIAPAQTFHNLR